MLMHEKPCLIPIMCSDLGGKSVTIKSILIFSLKLLSSPRTVGSAEAYSD